MKYYIYVSRNNNKIFGAFEKLENSFEKLDNLMDDHNR